MVKVSASKIMLITLTALHDFVFNSIKEYISSRSLDIEVINLNDMLNIFELIGPSSLTVLNSAIRPSM